MAAAGAMRRTTGTGDGATGQGLPADAALEERRAVIRRTLRALPDKLLAALSRGLERSSDELVAGRLFRAPSGGGCPVGVMLRELDPEAYRGGPLVFWLRHGWRRRAAWYGDALGRNPRLRHLEWSFDEAVKRTRELQPERSRRDAASAVGEWIRVEVERERGWRLLQDAALLPSRSSPPPSLAGVGGTS
jgi:hypothetical protein